MKGRNPKGKLYLTWECSFPYFLTQSEPNFAQSYQNHYSFVEPLMAKKALSGPRRSSALDENVRFSRFCIERNGFVGFLAHSINHTKTSGLIVAGIDFVRHRMFHMSTRSEFLNT